MKGFFFNLAKIVNTHSTTYKVTHKGWDFSDDCTELILFVSLYSCFPATVNLLLSAPLNKPLKDYIQSRKLNLTLGSSLGDVGTYCSSTVNANHLFERTFKGL